MANNSKGSTLCWDCAKSCRVGLCPWVDKGEPVDGWWANESTLVYKNTYTGNTQTYNYYRETPTYEVIACPKFVRNSYRGGLNEKEDQPHRFKIEFEKQKDVRALAAAILLRAVTDWKTLDGLETYYMPDGDMIKACELRVFFFSDWFAELLRLVSNRSPAAVWKELGVKQESI